MWLCDILILFFSDLQLFCTPHRDFSISLTLSFMSCSSYVRRLSIETINVYMSVSACLCFALGCSALFRFRVVTFSVSRCLV